MVVTPKSLLRSPATRSPISELAAGSFLEVIDDAGVPDPAAVRRVVLASGKVAHEALHRRDQRLGGEVAAAPAGADAPTPGAGEVAVLRIEQLYPWPQDRITEVLGRYPGATEVIWLQEEPENMGAWSFVHSRLHRLLRDRYQLRHVSRVESASPATGSTALHQLEQADLLARTVG